ncbi:single-stranded DNA-binding protein [Bifidobacterium sp.]|uniref:single-stranded DNA-binding protein n=1 Tax=Bifidobacterium sp. TaxID=41200 RepID=UPI0025BCAE5F|nr:single-stranded DNA-binding protein [Bifidobacterium sp.]MCI1635425.1 single-stranded DNA-binding protein [Bifidobacterium sp.]
MGVQQGLVTVTGYVAKEPRRIGDLDRTPLCVLRLASTRSYFDAKTQRWKDFPTLWITVKTYRSLANNIMTSVHKGDPIIVVGLLSVDEWKKDGRSQFALVIEASAVGHDLGLGSTQFSKRSTGQEMTAQPVTAPSPASSSSLSHQETIPSHQFGDGDICTVQSNVVDDGCTVGDFEEMF